MNKVSIGELRRLYEDTGFSFREIEHITGVPYSTVRGRLIAAGVKMRRRGGNHKKMNHNAVRKTAFLYERGYSTNEIATIMEVNPSTVKYRLEQHGIELRTAAESVRLRWERTPKRTGYTIAPQEQPA